MGDAPEAVAIADLDGDGDLDLATANGNEDSASVLLNRLGTYAVDLYAGQVATNLDFGNQFVNAAPVLADTEVEALLPLGASDAANRGTLVRNLTRGITDTDAGALQGIAITATNETNGTVQYTTDDGATWTDVGTVSGTSALLLANDGNTRVRFVHNGGFTGSVSNLITFRMGSDRRNCRHEVQCIDQRTKHRFQHDD